MFLYLEPIPDNRGLVPGKGIVCPNFIWSGFDERLQLLVVCFAFLDAVRCNGAFRRWRRWLRFRRWLRWRRCLLFRRLWILVLSFVLSFDLR